MNEVVELSKAIAENMLKGAGFSVVARQYGWDACDALEAIGADREASLVLESANQILRLNVRAAIYQSALKGNVQAQIAFLSDSADNLSNTLIDEFSEMSDEELLERAASEGIPIPESMPVEGRSRLIDERREHNQLRGDAVCVSE